MTAYERAIKRGRWLIARRKFLPVALLAGCVLALLLATPFRVIHGQQWLTVLSAVLAISGIALYALASAPAAFHAARREEGPVLLPEYVAAGGIYSITRFPTYTANLLLVAALSLYTGVVWFTVGMVLVAMMCTGWILLAQEHTLHSRYGDVFTQWCRETYALTPFFLSWQPWKIPVNPLRLLLGQAHTAAVVTGVFALTNLVKNWRVDFELRVDVPWLVIFGACLVLALLFGRNK
ncbi:MAG: hypothetical protein LBU95_04070 [Rikenellaceae bacterium]|jgi:protein-S-isoprenylcysteine O-methyltransferase Ste14|nr:hypothetical protein [Rikenellaceae bacterium]